MIKFKIGTIPVVIHPFFWLLACAISLLNAATVPQFGIWMAIIFISILVHELGHATTAQAFGQRAHIDLIGFGGLTKGTGPKLKLWQQFIVVLNGPLAGFMLAGLAWFISRQVQVANPHPLLIYSLTIALYINVFWTILNLIPVQPLDGSKLMTILLESIFGLRGVKIALFISFVLAAALCLFFFIINDFLIGAVFGMFAFEGYRSWQSSLMMTDKDKDLVLQHLLKEAESDLRKGNKGPALEKLQRIRQLAKSGVIYLAASEQAAHLLVEQGHSQEAYELLHQIKSKLSPEALRVLHHLAYSQGQWQEAISLGDKAFQAYPSYEVAVINALSHSVLGNVRPAIGWLQCALQQGLPDMRELLRKKEFDPIRQDPLFVDFENKVK